MRGLTLFVFGLVGGVSLAGCGESSTATEITLLEACEQATLGVIANPSSYQRADDQNPEAELVYVQYDSLNAYGAMVRGYSRCRFDVRENGAPTLAEFSVNGNNDPVLLEMGQEAIDRPLLQ